MNEHHPLISVILPVHNGERYLSEAVESVLNQTFRDFELIIVENASTDRSFEIAHAFAMQDDRVRVFHSNEAGAARAMNQGVAHARGGWFARMDADDVWLPEKLERQWQFIQNNPDLDVVSTWGWHIGEMGKRIGMFQVGPTTRSEFQRLRDGNEVIYLLSPSTMFSRRAAIATGGHDPDYPVSQDVEYWTRLADRFSVLTLAEPLVLYRVHASACSTHQMTRQLFQAERVKHNAGLRRSGMHELTSKEYAELRSQRPLLTRMGEKITWQSQTFYRRGGANLAADKIQGVGWLALSGLLDPFLLMRRLRRQRVFTTLRSR